jgi:NAD(P)-dependent dehydrogenase (short-subunit alcohol dehydrogenase family)
MTWRNVSRGHSAANSESRYFPSGFFWSVCGRPAIKAGYATDADWALSVGVEAPFRVRRSAIPILAAAGGGAIVNVASCQGLRPGPGHAVYCMTKAAIARS